MFIQFHTSESTALYAINRTSTSGHNNPRQTPHTRHVHRTNIFKSSLFCNAQVQNLPHAKRTLPGSHTMVTPDEQKVCATEPKVWNIYSILTSLARSSIPSRPTGSGHQIGLIRRESIRRGGLFISVVSLTCRKVPPALSYISLRIRDISSMSMESGSLSGQRAAVHGSGTMTRSISHRISAVDGM